MKLILKKPVVTEKSSMLQEANNQYTFLVERNSNKIEIKKAVEVKFGVSVKKVNTVNYIGKAARVGKFFGKKSDFKKAVVTLNKGETLDVYGQA